MTTATREPQTEEPTKIEDILSQLPFPVGLFGSCLRKPHAEASDIDLVIEEPGRHIRRLKALARSLEKPLDVFMPPLMEEERTSKMFITPDGVVTTDSVYCGKGFFDGITPVGSAQRAMKANGSGRQTKRKGEHNA
jgi:predicted nucleotidyltransferase